MKEATSDGCAVRRPWEEKEGFRETLAVCLADDEERTTLRRFGALLFRLLLERSGPGPRGRVLDEDSSTRTELSAVAAELRHLTTYLEEIGRGWRENDLGPDDAELSKFAARLVRRVRWLADEVEQELGRGVRQSEPRP